MVKKARRIFTELLRLSSERFQQSAHKQEIRAADFAIGLLSMPTA